MFVKVCGITRLGDAEHALEQGATALGFVLWRESPRHVSPALVAEMTRALPREATTVGVFVNEPVESLRDAMRVAGLRVVQLHGDESPEVAGDLEWPVFRALGLDDEDEADRWAHTTTILLDALDKTKRGGTGQRIDWRRAAAVARRRRVILAGGLTPENVAEAIEVVRPYGVDVSSGVERAPGIKDPDKVTRFIESSRRAFERLAARREGHAS